MQTEFFFPTMTIFKVSQETVATTSHCCKTISTVEEEKGRKSCDTDTT